MANDESDLNSPTIMNLQLDVLEKEAKEYDKVRILCHSQWPGLI